MHRRSAPQDQLRQVLPKPAARASAADTLVSTVIPSTHKAKWMSASSSTANIQVLWLSYGLPVSTYLPDAPYGIGASLPTAFFNLKSYGLDQLAVRKAIAMAVDYATIIANAMTNQSATFSQVPRSLMNPTAGEQALYDNAAVKDLQWAGNDIAGAKKLLDDAGIKDTNGDGWREFNGRSFPMWPPAPMAGPTGRLPLKWLLPPVKRSALRSRPTTRNGVRLSDRRHQIGFALPEGYDIFMMWSDGAGPTQPWGRIRHLISSEFVGMASNWNGNWGQYSNPAADELITGDPR